MNESMSVLVIEGSLPAEITKPKVEVTRIVDRLGFGEGGISHEERKLIIGEELLPKVEATIMSSDILVPVSRDKEGNLIDDDGCGDGRAVKTVFEGTSLRNKSLNRSKVFGGGVAMTFAMKIGMGDNDKEPMNEVFHSAISTLKDKKIDFGAHTDEHNSNNEVNSGCGAIDKAPAVVANVSKYKEQIRGAIEALGADTSGLDEVFSNFASYSENTADQEYSGKQVAKEIVSNGKIVKELRDDHNEMYVVLNAVEGYTTNQELIRDITDEQVQVFGVDVWRMQELAVREYPGNAEAQNRAFLSELAYTLGVSATLTLGDLPVYVVSEKPNN